MTDVTPAAAALEAGQESVSGGHLVAQALKAEGVDVIFTLCGGHIIDIYDGQTGLCGCNCRARNYRRGHRGGQCLPGREPDAADRWPGRH